MSRILVLFLLAWRLGAQQLEIHYINVGWGGAVWVKGPDGATVLLEAGDTGRGTGRVVPYLQHQGLFPEDFGATGRLVTHALSARFFRTNPNAIWAELCYFQ